VSHKVELTNAAEKSLDRMDRATERRIRQRLKLLANDPYEHRISKRLKGMSGIRSSRVGGWRILYTVVDGDKIVYVASVEPRGKAYR